jgi:hypothetical protein
MQRSEAKKRDLQREQQLVRDLWSHALTPAQGLERGRDGGEEKVMTVTRA